MEQMEDAEKRQDAQAIATLTKEIKFNGGGISTRKFLVLNMY